MNFSSYLTGSRNRTTSYHLRSFYRIVLIFSLIFFSSLFAVTLNAEPKKTGGGMKSFEPTVDVDAAIVSNYVFRGEDVFDTAFERRDKAYSSFNPSPAFQPGVTIQFTSNWSFTIWGSFALTGRQDADADRFLQAGPGENGDAYLQAILDGIENNTLPDIESVIATIEADPFGTGDPLDYKSVAGRQSTAPGFHKEPNGLKRRDEVDFELKFTSEVRYGTFSGGLAYYNYTDPIESTPSDLEIFVGFSPAKLENLSLLFYVEALNQEKHGSTYTQLQYEFEHEFTDSVSVSLSPSVGFYTSTEKKIRGWRNFDLPLLLNIGNFYIGVTGVYRLDLRFFDYDTALGSGVALWGDSSMNDGLTENPAGNNGLVNSLRNYYINNEISNYIAGYTFTERQHIPRFLYYYTIGYTMQF